MFYIPIQRDFSKVKNKVALGLTKRQLVCFSAAAIVGIPVYLVLKKYVSTDIAGMVMITVMLPFFLFAMYEKNGQPLEEVMKNIIKEKIFRKPVRPVINEPLVTSVIQTAEYAQDLESRKKEGSKGFAKNKKGKKVIGPDDELSTEMLREYARAMHKAQKEGKRAPKSAAESIPFRRMDESGLMDLGGGRYSVMMEFSDKNYIQADDDEQKNIWSEWCTLLNSLDTEAEFQMVFFNRKAEVGELARKLEMVARDPENRQIVRELNANQRKILASGNKGLTKSKYFLVTFKTPFFKAKAKADEITERLKAEFLEKMDVEARVLNGYERLSILFLMLNPYKDEKFIFNWDAAKNGGISEKEQITNHAFEFGRRPDRFMIGSKVGCASYLRLDASKLSDRVLCKMLDVDSPITVSFHFAPVPQEKAVKSVKALISNLQKMVIDEQKTAARQGYGMENISTQLRRDVDEAEKLMDAVSQNDETMFTVTITIVNVADSVQELERAINQVVSIAREESCELIKLEHQQEDGFFSTLPLGNNRIGVKRQLTTTSLGVFLPYKIKELMQFGDSICMGQNKITGHIIMADVKTLANPNTLVLGKPGGGKSFSIKMLIIQTYMKLKDDILICDPEGEYGPLVTKLKGQIIHLSQSSREHINPLHIDPNCDWTSDPVGNKCQLIMSIYEQILGPGKIGAFERSILDRCTKKLYEKFIRTKDVRDLPILEDLYNELDSQKEEEAAYLRTSLEVYVHGSLNYFNHQTNVDMNNRVICFDIRELGEQLKNLAMLVVQETVWGRVTVNRSAGKYTRYFVDEFHLLLKEPQTASYSKEIWKRFRKWGGIPVGITQNVSDLMESAEIQSIFYNSDCYILLGQAPGDADTLKETLKLSNEQYKCMLTKNKGEGLLVFGGTILPFSNHIDENTQIYKTITTKVTEAR
jgi:hypothetical protein